MAGPSHKKQFIPTAPIKGSFPLDHDGACKEIMLNYMICLSKNSAHNEVCRQEARDYLQCRMDNNLMRKEDWSKLGYANDTTTMGRANPE